MRNWSKSLNNSSLTDRSPYHFDRFAIARSGVELKSVALQSRKNGRRSSAPVAVSNRPARHLSSRRQRERENLGTHCRSSHRNCHRSVQAVGRHSPAQLSVGSLKVMVTTSDECRFREDRHRNGPESECPLRSRLARSMSFKAGAHFRNHLIVSQGRTASASDSA